MKINGLQKTTLLDYPGKVACTLFTPGCNFRCPFCHNAGLVLGGEGETLSESEILRFLEKRKGILEGVCVTGGEPLLQPDIGDFLAKVKALGLSVKLDTNGSFPARLKSLVSAGVVDYVAMDIKNSPAKYAQTVGVPNFDLAPVRESVEFLKQGALPFEFRTTVVRELHEAEDFEEIGRWIQGAPQYFLQNFTDSGELLSPGLSAHPAERLKSFAAIAEKYVKKVGVRGI